jgi:peroxiredoxin
MNTRSLLVLGIVALAAPAVRADEIVDRQQSEAEKRWLDAWTKGPTRTRWSTLPVQAGDTAPDAELKDSTGTKRKLSALWKDKPVLLVFLRHFGCGCLADRWERLKTELPELEKAGVTVVAVGQAEPERSAAVATRRGYPFLLLSDPERRVYEAYGLLEGSPAQILQDRAYEVGDAAGGQKMCDSRRGTEKAVVDSPWQLPGEFLIAKGGRIVLAHRYQFCQDFPAKGVLLGAASQSFLARADQRDHGPARTLLDERPREVERQRSVREAIHAEEHEAVRHQPSDRRERAEAQTRDERRSRAREPRIGEGHEQREHEVAEGDQR